MHHRAGKVFRLQMWVCRSAVVIVEEASRREGVHHIGAFRESQSIQCMLCDETLPSHGGHVSRALSDRRVIVWLCDWENARRVIPCNASMQARGVLECSFCSGIASFHDCRCIRYALDRQNRCVIDHPLFSFASLIVHPLFINWKGWM